MGIAELTFSAEPPFDRHDWIVTRPSPDAPATPQGAAPSTTTTRYVIDYYSGPEDEDGNPVFVLDVRPALDDFASLAQRVKMGWEDWKTGEHENQ
jgi:cytochrome c heme-lyase